jgi:ABC-type sulfate/molybdate transport systems ATPase subunit
VTRLTRLEAQFVLTKGGPGGGFALEVSLRLEPEVLVLFGPTGAGKTLTLAVLAGLERPDHGFIRFGDDVFFDGERGLWVPPHRRGAGYVPQRSSLFPFIDVLGNVTFGLPRSRRKEDDAKSMALLDELGLAHRAHARADDLSGGERQKVALARALLTEPRYLLLDEPFASIDRKGRESLGKTLRDILARRRVPVVLVTHDADEAIEMGTRLVPVESGKTREPVLPRAFFERQ